MNTPTRPASPAEITQPIDYASLRAPRVPADLAALVVAMLESRRDFKLATRGEVEAP